MHNAVFSSGSITLNKILHREVPGRKHTVIQIIYFANVFGGISTTFQDVTNERFV